MNEPEAMKLRANEPLQSGNTSEPGAPALRQTLGSPSIVFMVLAAAAPLTAAAGVLPLSFLFSDNFAAPVYFVVATVLMLLFAVGYTALSKYVPNAGAFYAYIAAGLGRIPGNAAAMLAVGASFVTGPPGLDSSRIRAIWRVASSGVIRPPLADADARRPLRRCHLRSVRRRPLARPRPKTPGGPRSGHQVGHSSSRAARTATD